MSKIKNSFMIENAMDLTRSIKNLEKLGIDIGYDFLKTIYSDEMIEVIKSGKEN